MRIHPEPFRPVENRRIFVVEDDEVIRSALQFILDDRNEAHAFRSLDLAFAKAANVRPDVVLLGIRFLQSDGKRRLAEIACRLSNAKILIVADSLRDPLALRSLDEGAHGVLGKPITFDSVHGKVNTVLDESSLSLVSLG